MAQLYRTSRAMVALVALSGCTLVDQRTFDRAAGQPPVHPRPPPPPAPLAPPLPGAPPLLSIRLPEPPSLQADIGRAVAAARARKPTVAFDVVEITPGTQAGTEAASIARMIVAQGVPPARVSLSARPIPGAAPEIRIFVH